MKLTLNQLLEAEPTIVRLRSQPLRPILARRVARIIDQAKPHIVEFHRIRDEAIQRHGQPLPDKPDAYQVTPENMPAFVAEMNELIGDEFDLDARPITYELLDKELSLTMTPDEVAALGPLLVEAEPS